MVQAKGMPGLVRFRRLWAGSSKYSTWRFDSSSSLSAASFAMPISTLVYSLFVRLLSRADDGTAQATIITAAPAWSLVRELRGQLFVDVDPQSRLTVRIEIAAG